MCTGNLSSAPHSVNPTWHPPRAPRLRALAAQRVGQRPLRPLRRLRLRLRLRAALLVPMLTPVNPRVTFPSPMSQAPGKAKRPVRDAFRYVVKQLREKAPLVLEDIRKAYDGMTLENPFIPAVVSGLNEPFTAMQAVRWRVDVERLFGLHYDPNDIGLSLLLLSLEDEAEVKRIAQQVRGGWFDLPVMRSLAICVGDKYVFCDMTLLDALAFNASYLHLPLGPASVGLPDNTFDSDVFSVVLFNNAFLPHAPGGVVTCLQKLDRVRIKPRDGCRRADDSDPWREVQLHIAERNRQRGDFEAECDWKDPRCLTFTPPMVELLQRAADEAACEIGMATYIKYMHIALPRGVLFKRPFELEEEGEDIIRDFDGLVTDLFFDSSETAEIFESTAISKKRKRVTTSGGRAQVVVRYEDGDVETMCVACWWSWDQLMSGEGPGGFCPTCAACDDRAWAAKQAEEETSTLSIV